MRPHDPRNQPLSAASDLMQIQYILIVSAPRRFGGDFPVLSQNGKSKDFALRHCVYEQRSPEHSASIELQMKCIARRGELHNKTE
jgi:hypothetical protein